MVGQQVSFFNPTLPLRGQPLEHVTQVPPQFSVNTPQGHLRCQVQLRFAYAALCDLLVGMTAFFTRAL